ncbi:AMP-binding protein [Rhodopila sp.]|uniref:AMP-binding protein n=1 Tax=Rhodopila sp. TaxID=2480087 RepID=UPI003D10CD29
MTATATWVRALEATKKAASLTLHSILDQAASAYPDRPALLDAHHMLTYTAFAERANWYAHWALAQGIAGATVGLLIPNCLEYVPIWLGFTRVGCTVALLNTNLSGEALRHSLAAAQATHLIADARVPLNATQTGVRHVWRWPMHDWLGNLCATPPDVPLPAIDSVALYVYTSGTTGLPKATRITHRRIVEWSCWFGGMMDVQPEDRLYDCLPLYHSTGGITAIGAMLVKGASVYIKDRFSTGQFWDDIVRHECTIFQYIGELCRYLILASPHPLERQHKLRLACGNGMRGDVWERFQERFAIPRILEFYAATEGALSLYNVEGKLGAIGRIPPFLARSIVVAIIRCDPETGQPLHDEQGFCARCTDDEPGEAISRIVDGRRFDGYTDGDATHRKLLSNVFETGDLWYRSGDLMRRDHAGFFYFVDRLGDTFRWKGENVSTTEVASILQRCSGVIEAFVYGVSVAGNEGRAGMVALTTSDEFRLDDFAAHCLAHLPVYARPLFIRLARSLDLTGTFKPTKASLARQGYDHSPDPVWRMEAKTGGVQPYDASQITP